MADRELAPCPFCGGRAELDTHRSFRALQTGRVENACAVYCLECSADQSFCYSDAPGVDREAIVADVIARWNRRPTLGAGANPPPELWLWFADIGTLRKWSQWPFPHGRKYLLAGSSAADGEGQR
jgi:hypothetical protein